MIPFNGINWGGCRRDHLGGAGARAIWAVRAVNDVSLSLRGWGSTGADRAERRGEDDAAAVDGGDSAVKRTVRVLGHDLTTREEEAVRNLGFTPDTPVFYESLTVRQFLQFIAMGYGLSDAEAGERIAFWIEKVWLTEKANQKIRSLSRGMRQRVGLARTLLPNPAVVLLDEPAAGLDPAGRVQFRQLMSDLREQGKAIVISSHILADMEEYCTHIGVMRKGRWCSLAPWPKSLRTAALMAAAVIPRSWWGRASSWPASWQRSRASAKFSVIGIESRLNSILAANMRRPCSRRW